MIETATSQQPAIETKYLGVFNALPIEWQKELIAWQTTMKQHGYTDAEIQMYQHAYLKSLRDAPKATE